MPYHKAAVPGGPINITDGELGVISDGIARKVVEALGRPGGSRITIDITAQKELFIEWHLEGSRRKKLYSFKKREEPSSN